VEGGGICGHFVSRTLDQNTHLHLTVRAGNTLFRASEHYLWELF